MKAIYGVAGVVLGVSVHWVWEWLQQREDALMQSYLKGKRITLDQLSPYRRRRLEYRYGI